VASVDKPDRSRLRLTLTSLAASARQAPIVPVVPVVPTIISTCFVGSSR
jgi:hypothetical protein